MPKKGSVPSPCVNRCDRHERFPWCATCRRTAAEIRDWERMDDPARKKTLLRCQARVRDERANPADGSR